MPEFLEMSIISLPETLLRVALALTFGAALGLERDHKNKPIDFRAYMIIAASTCIVAIMGQELYSDYAHTNDFVSLDLGKIISGVLTGIGFLGAGAIIKIENDKIVGSATGASIWASGGIGLCLGFGMYGLAGIAFIAIASVLIIGGFFIPAVRDNSKDET
jgi:putative Mg2+ transporter-C (MgtC) family protein